MYNHNNVMPNTQSKIAKKQQVASMFDAIAHKYDFLNRFLSVGIDKGWRKKAINQLATLSPQIVLDVATGTADVALLTHKLLQPKKIIGIDISQGMLELGRKKIAQQNLQNSIEIFLGDSEDIKYNNDYFDAVTVAYGVRNFENLETGLQEILRVLKPNGKLVILEFSKPNKPFFKGIYNFYMNKIMPQFGNLFSGNKEAYTYLNKSVQAFPEGQNFIDILDKLGYQKTYLQPLSLGICTIYCGSK
jgi:demethylmenaquinone methyltransferase / 2-methoxy-6-polyprenyl-1,4-benzoquinol methylase